MGFAAKILADSISPDGFRITTWEATFPRIILAEVNTHCMLSRNSASSRAVPVQKRLASLVSDSFLPEVFGKNKGGMQPGEAIEGDDDTYARMIWLQMRDQAMKAAGKLAEIGVHKQYANRLLEPFLWHTAVITATDVDNLFNLRVNPMAMGEFQHIAALMKKVRDESEPRTLNYGEYHLPYVDPGEAFDLEVQNIEAWKVSVGRCARVSYLTQDGVRDPNEDVGLSDRLDTNGHMSPLEHVARPMSRSELVLTRSFDITLENGVTLRTNGPGVPKPGRIIGLENGEEFNIVAVRGPLHYAGKLNGWVSRRQFVRGEHDILGYRAAGAQ